MINPLENIESMAKVSMASANKQMETINIVLAKAILHSKTKTSIMCD